METRSQLTPLGWIFAACLIVTISGLGGWVLGGRQCAERVRVNQRRAALREPATVSMDRAVTLASMNALTFGLPQGSEFVSVETSYDKNGEQRYLVRPWPPWPVDQPEGGAQPPMWRAVEVTPDGHCSLTEVGEPGRDPGKPASSTKRRVILPAP